jgi:hypothetical protein
MLRLVDFSSPRVTPLDLLGRLRDIDTNAELLYIGEGIWWTGVVRWNAMRYAAGQKVMQTQAERHVFAQSNALTVAMASLMMQGFGLVLDHRIQGEPDARIVQDFAEADWWYRHYRSLDHRFEEILKQSEKVPERLRAAVTARDRMHADRRYLWSRLVRRNPAPVPVLRNLKRSA